jgi:hypothetical protein
MLFRQEYLRVAEQLFLIRRREAAEDRKIALEDCAPRGWNRLRAKSCASAGFEQVENHAED